jgi:putative colanic acid biosysnthesis UDP-glucose lipid carrier transferase
VAVANWFDQAADSRLIVAAVFGFALTYPGSVSLTDSVSDALRKCIVTALTISAAFALYSYASAWLKFVPRRELLLWFAALPTALFGSQMLARSALPKLIEWTGTRSTVVVCGVNEIGANLAARLQSHRYHGVRFVGFFDDRKRERLTQIGDRPLLGSFSELGEYVRLNHIERIYMALPMATQPRILKMLGDLEDSTASIYFVPDIFVTDIVNGRVESVLGMPVVAVRETPYAGVDSVVKRLEDLLLSTVGLVVASPLMLAIAAAIKLSSKGPVIFAQRRYGIDGREIVVYKFRTMSVTEDCDDVYRPVRKDGDQRVTSVGHFLRRASLDELPQLLNVLQGRMSLVGPRPHVVAVNEQFRKQIPSYMLRHKVKPGITGLAQVRGFRGGDDFDGMSKRIASDIEYLRTWTLGLDLWILFRTVLMVLWDRKAF